MPMISEANPVAFADPLPDEVDVLVIGAGVVGVSTAYFLARSGVRVAVCEKGRVAGEQSSRNWGWVRQQGRDPAELPIVMESNRIWRGLAEETGERDLAFTECGCLYLATGPEQMSRWEEWREMASRHQLESRLLTAPQVEALVPDLAGRWSGGIFTPSDGRAEPFVAVPALARAARRLGAAVVENCAVRTLETEAGRVAAVHTERGRTAVQAVVLAGGAWSTFFASNLGIDLPQLTVRATVGRTNPVGGGESPAVYSPGLCLRRRADGGYTVAVGDLIEHYVGPRSFRYLAKFRALLGASARSLRVLVGPPRGFPGSWGGRRRWTADEVTPFERTRVLNPPPSEVVLRRISARLPVQAPRLAEAGMAEAWAGMIDVTPDAVPYLCEAPSPRGLFIGTGMSGHGFGIGPGAGRVLADLVQGRPHGHDLTRFRFERFSDGSPVVPGPY